MSDMYSNGLQWENLALKLIELFSVLSETADSVPSTWHPTLPSTGPELVAADEWLRIEADYRQSVHEAARALIGTARVPDPTPEVMYFLGVRLRAALGHVEALCVLKDERPVSLWAFPDLPPDEVLEWLLTDWADDHAIMIALPATCPPLFVSS
jgi:hypothetical protein